MLHVIRTSVNKGPPVSKCPGVAGNRTYPLVQFPPKTEYGLPLFLFFRPIRSKCRVRFTPPFLSLVLFRSMFALGLPISLVSGTWCVVHPLVRFCPVRVPEMLCTALCVFRDRKYVFCGIVR